MTAIIRIFAIVGMAIGFNTLLVVGQDSLQVDDVVITGTRYALPVEQSGKTIYKITREDIEKSAGVEVQDLLNRVPGIHLNGNFGTPGTNIGYSSRGGGERQLLILVDGVPMNDPSGIESFYDLRLLSIDQIESIEVLKGGLSSLYGAGASTGVVNIQLRKAAQDKIGGSVNIQAGSYGAIDGSVFLNGKSKGHSFAGSLGVDHIEGFSAASEAMSTEVFDKDGIDRLNGMLKYGYQFNDQFSIDVMGMYNDIDLEYDDGSFADAPNRQLVSEYRIGITPEYNYNRGKVTLQLNHTDADRSFESSFPSSFTTRISQLELTHRHQLSAELTAISGIQWQQLSYGDAFGTEHAVTKINLFDPYTSLVYNSENGFDMQVGIRLNNHSEYGANLVFNLNPSFLFDINRSSQLKLFGSISSSYNPPSLYQLKDPFFGNPALEPEGSLNAEFGFSLYWKDNLTWNVAYFNREESNPIGFESQFDDMFNFIGGNYITAASRRNVSGIETDINWEVNSKWQLAVNYSHVNSSNVTSLYRLPQHKAAMGLRFAPSSATSLQLNYLYTGSRKSFEFFVFEEVELDSYGLLDLQAQHRLLGDRLTIHGSLFNLLGTDYTELFGFTTRGRNWKFGLRWSF